MKAIVTGHTHGLGAAIAAELLARGIAVLGLARSIAPPLAQQYQALFRQVSIDLADTDSLAAWLAGGELERYFAGADTALLVNNAGTVQPVGALPQQDPLAVMQAVMLNVGAPLVLSAAVAGVEGLRQRRIVHVSSGAGRKAYPGWSVYCATKAALDHHARAAMRDAVPGLLVCSLAPGVIDTAMQAQIRATAKDRFPDRARFVDMHKNGELVSPKDCAGRLVDYLLADRFGREPVDDLRN
jgi:benzil reductase ((S)-benzoin forming)